MKCRALLLSGSRCPASATEPLSPSHTSAPQLCWLHRQALRVRRVELSAPVSLAEIFQNERETPAASLAHLLATLRP